MSREVKAYRIPAYHKIAVPSTFWEAIQENGQEVAKLDGACVDTMMLLCDYGAECGVPIPHPPRDDFGEVIVAPAGVNVLCYLTPHDLTVIGSRWSKRSPDISSRSVKECFEFVVAIANALTREEDRLLIVVQSE